MISALMQRFKPKYNPGWLVTQSEPSGVRWIYMCRGDDKRPVVRACGMNLYAEIGSSLHLQHQSGKLAKYRSIVLLRSDEYRLIQAELPVVPADEMREAFRWSLRELIDQNVEELGVDYLEIPQDQARVTGSNRPAYAVCAAHAVLQRYQNAFRAQKAQLTVADVPECAHRNLAGLAAHSHGNLALLSLMHDHCVLSFISEGDLCMARRIDVGMQNLIDNPDRRLSMLDSILLEMQRSLDAYERQFHFAPLARVLVSSSPDEVDVLSFISDNIDLSVLPLALGDLIDFDAVPKLRDPLIQAEYLSLLGAGLRPEMR